MNTLIVDISGWIGAILLLLAYGLVSRKKVAGDAISYQLLNAVGSIFLIVNSFYYKAYPSVAVNVFWISIALITMLQYRKKAKEAA
jgi:hypothetical protein